MQEEGQMVPAPHRQQSQRIAARIAARLAAKLSAFGQGMQLPPRVRRELEREQYLSELLVTSLQLLVLLLFAVLYLETPPGFSPDAPIRAVPLGISLFAVLALVRLYLAMTGQLANWMVGLSVVAEMAVLIFVIWAYHLQYEQPAQMYLKTTEFAYIFSLIALRALRFEPLWVALSGLTATLGWLLLLHYALTHASGNPITWDYVTALRSTQIHYGAELDKLLSILIVSAVLALALARARGFVVRAVRGQQAVADLSLFFDDSVANRITDFEANIMAGHAELRDASIVFLDMRGFTQAAAMLQPSALIQLLGEYQSLVVPIVKAHGGSIDKFMGDGILASFGAVTADDRHAANALHAIDAILVAVDQWRVQRQSKSQPAPDVGAGMASGPVLFGILGHGSRLEYTVIGDTVNLAAKLEKQNKTQGTRGLTTRASYQQARRQGYLGEKHVLPEQPVDGVSGTIHLVDLALGSDA
ncbi:adenylate/guanylate cyclase domain-containing protein [Cupriavidus sp. KK10]|jgi:adenylate cyclase|uniref:adenylate/guanylate cyclase domain-containing protein n=1 Tax=Cupriavidus sp. KK10 TaxID=1478019 RepID=UPI001BAB7330|nr:adenylate/guanylate cyclase domain-containing protein [Cupriavidus sp. KK10]QUN26678.1 adenylate/guanylate cyclase domain-containing protein [Cupriavidus sp. KK10]